MTDLITGTLTTTQSVSDGSTTLVVSTAVVSLENLANAISIGTGAATSNLIVSGIVASENGTAIRAGENDIVTITQTGQILGTANGSEGIFLGGGNTIATVSGFVEAADIPIFSFGGASDETDRVTITTTGVVQVASDRDSNGFSAAVGMSGSTGTTTILENYGTIMGTEAALTGFNTAVSNASFSFDAPRFLNPDTMIEMQFTNGGIVIGDVLLLGGEDSITNFGSVDGSVFLGNENDRYDGRGGLVTGFIQGENGNDTLIGGAQTDNMTGGENSDLLFGRDGDDLLSGDGGTDTINGGGGNDDLFGGNSADRISGGSGDDIINGDSGTDELYGNSGDDTILGGTANDTISGGSGDDDLRGGNNADEIGGGSGNDTIRGESGSDVMRGGSGNDAMSGSSGNDEMDGGSGDDRLFGGSNNDTLEGTLGNDFLDGGSGNDSIRGGSDNDTIKGGTGRDTLSGGEGNDIFVFTSAAESANSNQRDTIIDFVATIDQIDLSEIADGLTFVESYTGAGNEVRYNDTIGRLYITTDTDAASEFSLDIGAFSGLTEDDLIL
ncbi:calcium-binding protein [Primorskyibacter sp. S187A]|uniref:calcium-binding protein n=1 Tax=Primorskyibacter sp. S187A TaxID=3415130 RepID=UPI003C7ABEF8